VLSGTPTQTGSFPITIKVTDGNGCTGIGGTYTLVIGCQTITVTNPGTTTGTAGVAFSQTFTQTGSIGGSTFTINTGTLPTGITLSAAGVLSGTPTQTGSFPITIKVTDGNGCMGTGSTYTLVIGCQTITVTNPGTTTGTAGTAFSQTFTQTGSIGGSTFSLNTGSLPTGLSLSAAGVLSGSPTQTGSFPITIKVTDGNGCTGTGSTYTLVIGCQTITVTNPGTTTGTAGTAFSQTFTQTGSIGGSTFSLNTGSLPTGLSLSAAGVLSGIPTQTGSFPITIKVTDGNGCTGTGSTYTLVISCQTITVTNPGTTTGTTGVAFSQTFTQTGAVGGATFTINTGSLPTGLTLSAAGVLSGTPTQTGSFPITVKVTGGNGCTGTGATYTLVIGSSTITVNLKLFLQGYYLSGSSMQPVLNNQGVPSSLATETDTITIDLHHPTTFALIDSKKAVLLTNGSVSVTFTQPAGSYYIGIRHRNTIETWSTNAVACTASSALYDFSDDPAKAMGDNQVLVESGVWAFYTGDLNQDGFVDVSDYPDFDNDNLGGVSGVYANTDMNGDGFVDVSDYPVFDNNNLTGVASIHP
ncbi:MAG: putative Ig domain-containing protein, partial [Ferruginibacter sp.]